MPSSYFGRTHGKQQRLNCVAEKVFYKYIGNGIFILTQVLVYSLRKISHKKNLLYLENMLLEQSWGLGLIVALGTWVTDLKAKNRHSCTKISHMYNNTSVLFQYGPKRIVWTVHGYQYLCLTTEVFDCRLSFFFRLRFPADRGPDMYGMVLYHINANVHV